MEAAARPEFGQPHDGAGTSSRRESATPSGRRTLRFRSLWNVRDADISVRQFADPRLDAGQPAAEAVRNSVPRDRAAWMYGYVGATLLAAAVCTVWSFVDLPAEAAVAVPDPEFWIVAVLAVIVDSWPFASPSRARTATVFSSVVFTFAVLLGWGLALAVIVQSIAVLIAARRLHLAAFRALFNVGNYALSFAAAALLLNVAGVPLLSEDELTSRPGTVAVVAILGSILAWLAVNLVGIATGVWLRFGGSWTQALMRSTRRDGPWTLSLLALGPLVIAAGNVNALLVPLMLVPLYTVTELARIVADQSRKARHDELTGLPNRKALFAQIRVEARAYSERSSRLRIGRRPVVEDRRRMALLLLDIDQFRRVNDALGHVVGDRLLGLVAHRLRQAMGADGFVARLGGDEFAVLAPRLADEEAAGVLASRVVDALAAPVTLDSLPLDVTAAIGVAIYPEHGTEGSTLLRHAEVAMYDAKDRASTYAIYTPEAEQHTPEKLALLADLRRSLDSETDELQLFYQPQVELATGAVVGAEALLRWNHPEKGFVSPEILIKLAEHTAVMRLITSRVIDHAVSQLAKWKAQGLILRTSINVSARDLHHPEFVDELANLLADRGVSANQIQLEITEGALMADPRRVLVTLHRLDKLGVALSLDDFGTGYSSLQHLRRLPLAEVKIDRSFVLGMATDGDDRAVVASIIGLGRALGLRVVAEGVEDDETRRLLVKEGCEVGQGWYFARPMPADAFATWLTRYRPNGAA
jgi:diguanylate cyclase (GGDEF)-like protein